MSFFTKLISVGAILGLMANFQASAQQPQQNGPSFSDKDLKTFVKAQEAVEKVASKKDPEEMQKAATQNELKKTIKENGISVEKYMAIIQGIQTNPELMKKFNQLRSK